MAKLPTKLATVFITSVNSCTTTQRVKRIVHFVTCHLPLFREFLHKSFAPFPKDRNINTIPKMYLDYDVLLIVVPNIMKH